MTLRGRMSWFGGPLADSVQRADEGLALYSEADTSGLFLDMQPPGTTGLARRLNTGAYYIACRWDYDITPKHWLRQIKVVVRNPQGGTEVEAYPVDWGPNIATGRVADLSPGILKALGLVTGDVVTITIPLPGEPTNS